jgi:hypothetical protein
VSQAAGPARERATVAAVRHAARARGAPRARGICRRVRHERHEEKNEHALPGGPGPVFKRVLADTPLARETAEPRHVRSVCARGQAVLAIIEIQLYNLTAAVSSSC